MVLPWNGSRNVGRWIARMGKKGIQYDIKAMEQLVKIEKVCWAKLFPIYQSLSFEEREKYGSFFEYGTGKRFGKPCLINHRLTSFDFCYHLDDEDDWDDQQGLDLSDVGGMEEAHKGLAVWFVEDWLEHDSF